MQSETLKAKGHYIFECFGPDGELKWRDEINNVVVTVGKNALLTDALQGSAYTVTGPYVGLISSVSYTGVVAGDTMTSHAGWTEAGATNAPTYTAPRKTLSLGTASGGVISTASAASFAITGTGTIEGAFIVFGTGALSTIDNTGGTLLSGGAFTTGAKTVGNGDTVNVSWSLTLT